MPVEVQIPKLGLTMREGTVARWLATEGQQVAAGDPVFELATDKVATEITAEAEGVLHQAVAEGTIVPVGGVAGWLLAPGEAPPNGSASSTIGRPVAGSAQLQGRGALGDPQVATERSGGGRILASPNARRVAAASGVDLRTVRGSGPGGRIVSEDVEEAALSAPPEVVSVLSGGTDVVASPLARRLALRVGVDLAGVTGSGPGGRVTVDDVVAAGPGPGRGPRTEPSTPAGASDQGEEPRHRAGDRIPLRGMRGIIAERMHASLHEMAQLTLVAEAGAGAIMELRQRLRQEWEPDRLSVPGVTDFVIKAAALALRHHPLLNATVADGEILLLREISVGMAVALDDGLLVPVVRHADLLPIADLAAETTRLAGAARDGHLQLDELEGHTFSVTGLGGQGIDAFTPVINAPDVAILGIGRIRDTVAWDGDRPAKARVITLSLTIDHRVVDGAPGAAFLRSVAEYLESPMRLLA